MSKKARPRRAPAARKPPAIDQNAAIERLLSSMWAAVESGNPLRAEFEVAHCLALPRIGRMDAEEGDDYTIKVLVDDAIDRWDEEGAALLRVLMTLGSPGVKRAAGAALAEMTQAGIFPPDWVTHIGKAVPVQARRRYDIFGDYEALAVTFRYGDAEHAIVVQVDLTRPPVAIMTNVYNDPAQVLEAMIRVDGSFDSSEPVDLAEARRRLEGPLARCDEQLEDELTLRARACLPIARARMRRLPAKDADVPEFTAADYAAAVEDFMKSPLAADAAGADTEATRFWAELFSGYNGRIPGMPPAQVGPIKLVQILLGQVATAVVLSPEQRRHLEPAVAAWLRWSAECRGLDEAATARLAQALTETLPKFDEAYDRPGMAAARQVRAEAAR